MIDTLMPLIKQFIPFAQKRMKFSDPPRLFLRGDDENAQNPLGKTAQYDPAEKSITIYITGRHPKDVMRSLSHELVHHSQCCRGDIGGKEETSPGYAQNDDHMREMEREAYEVGNMCFRDWEDGIKSTIYFEHLQKGAKTMSTKDWKNKEMGTLLSEAWGFGFKLNENEQNEGKSHDCSNHVKENATGREGRCINHTLTENSDVTHYTVEFDDEIVENIPVSELTELAGVTHSHAGKRDDYEYDEKKPRREHKISDDEPLEEEEELEERRGRGRADPRIQRGPPDPRARPLEEVGDDWEAGAAEYDKQEPLLQLIDPPGEDDEAAIAKSTKKRPPADDSTMADKIVKGIAGDGTGALEEEEEIEERRGRGRVGPHTRGTPDPRLREAIKDVIRKALKAEGVSKMGRKGKN